MKTPIQIATKYAGDAIIDQLAQEIEDYGNDRYSDGYGTGYGQGKQDATIRTKRGY